MQKLDYNNINVVSKGFISWNGIRRFISILCIYYVQSWSQDMINLD